MQVRCKIKNKKRNYFEPIRKEKSKTSRRSERSSIKIISLIKASGLRFTTECSVRNRVLHASL